MSEKRDKAKDEEFDQNKQGTNEPWKRPGQASQDPSLPDPRPRERTWEDNATS